MQRYILHVSEDWRIRLPNEVVAALGDDRENRVVDMGRYCELTLPNGDPIVAPAPPAEVSTSA